VNFSRYAIYYIPDLPLFQIGSDWLGWNSITGQETTLAADHRCITDRPRKYGFHATVKPPFSLASNSTQGDLQDAFQTFCASVSPATGSTLKISRLGRFLAMTQDVQSNEVTELAASTVSHFDKFRAPLSDQDIAKRRQRKLTPQQDALMLRWGYPYVMQEFKFHMTLTGPLAANEIDAIEQRANTRFQEFIGQPLSIASLALLGEDRDSGHFHVVDKLSLGM
jgi:putative phosphonate metabolism protein